MDYEKIQTFLSAIRLKPINFESIQNEKKVGDVTNEGGVLPVYSDLIPKPPPANNSETIMRALSRISEVQKIKHLSISKIILELTILDEWLLKLSSTELSNEQKEMVAKLVFEHYPDATV